MLSPLGNCIIDFMLGVSRFRLLKFTENLKTHHYLAASVKRIVQSQLKHMQIIPMRRFDAFTNNQSRFSTIQAVYYVSIELCKLSFVFLPKIKRPYSIYIVQINSFSIIFYVKRHDRLMVIHFPAESYTFSTFHHNRNT